MKREWEAEDAFAKKQQTNVASKLSIFQKY